MALTKCSECGAQVSTRAQACPGCGAKPAVPTSIVTWVVVLLVVGLGIKTFVAQREHENPAALPTAVTTLNAIQPAAVTAPIALPTSPITPVITPEEAEKLLANGTKIPDPTVDWMYGVREDALGNKTYSAFLVSKNELDFKFPYSGKQTLNIFLRNSRAHGKEVLLTVEKGQFDCSLNECSVLVRFDQGKPQRFSATGPADHSTTVLFINNYDKFFSQLIKSKRMMIAPNFYQNGQPQMEFDTSLFDQEKYKTGQQ